jgi:hypothetical protein
MQYRQIVTLGAMLFLILLPQKAARAQSGNPVGVVQRLQGDVSIIQSGNAANVFEGMTISLEDRLVTGARARLQIILTDDTQIALGENAELAVKQYQFGPLVSEEKGVVVVELSKGAFLLTSGRTSRMEVRTVLADLTTTGMEVWAGSMGDGDEGVAVFGGTVEVSNEWGSVVLSARAVTQPRFQFKRSGLGTLLRSSTNPIGTTITRGEAPSEAAVWQQQKTDRAMDAITFDSEIARNFVKE